MDLGVEQKLLEELRELAEAAGEAIMAVYAGDFAVELKDDSSPLTDADRASHQVIRDGLQALKPVLPVLSEESPSEEVEDRAHWDCYWLVDPLDGTKEFVKRNGEFTVNIALIEHNRATLGVVLAPALGIEYVGGLGSGARRRAADGPSVPIRVSTARPEPIRGVGSRSQGMILHSVAMKGDFEVEVNARIEWVTGRSQMGIVFANGKSAALFGNCFAKRGSRGYKPVSKKVMPNREVFNGGHN